MAPARTTHRPSTGLSPGRRIVARARRLGPILTLAALLVADPAPAQPPVAGATTAPDADRKALGAELEAVLHDIDLGKERQTAIAADIEALGRDRGRLAEQLVATAARLRETEAKLGVTETRIADLDRDVERTRASLEARRAVLAEVLAALQRMGRNPPPALAVRPRDALDAVRSAILVGAVLPELKDRAEALLADLQTLRSLQSGAASERERFRAEATDLVAERQRLELLVEERRKTTGDREASLTEERRRTAELAQKAASLRDLLAALGGTGAPKPEPSFGRPSTKLADARGGLPLPVLGETVLRFGETDAAGLGSKGVSIAARSGAAVTSPCDGAVIFAGPFRSYGKLLIINGGGGYHVLLAGMERIDVEIGQSVLAGEPVGFMGARSDTIGGVPPAADRPILYVEFRKDGTPLDPSPWWAKARDEKVRG